MEPMDPIEQKLRKAMEREEPPEGFAERAVARALAQAGRVKDGAGSRSAAQPSHGWWGRLSGWWAAPAWRPALAASLAVLMVLAGAAGYREREARLRAEQARAEQARAELMLALDITRSALQRANLAILSKASTEPGVQTESQQ